MSHARERTEKICLNCNAQLSGRYCHVCGQENIDPRESIWSVITHFFNDITHFDGKFFRTVGLLIAKPGFLPLEYINGRRASYLHPIRLYIFTSAVFFLIFYTVLTPAIKSMVFDDDNSEFYKKYSVPSREIKPGEIPSPSDVVLNPLDTITAVVTRETNYKSVAEYDSVQKTLPADKRDGWLGSKLTRSLIARSNKYGGKPAGIRDSIIDDFTHNLPYLLFVSLPIFALFLQVLYLKNKNNLYAGNAIFLVYLYVFVFLVLLLHIFFGYLKTAFHQGWLEWFRLVLLLYIVYYSVKAMKRYYGQGRAVTILKYVVFNILAFATVSFLFVIFLLFSVIKV
ncbi:MAG: DUF3667 domain-containing protein [Chitinophagaceae bacterium]|nr:DUF3667 domain-containing protein [Chitinophagaceae bacterium]